MITDSVSSSGGLSSGPHAVELTRTPHYQAIELTRKKNEAAEDPGLGDPNFLLLGAGVVSLVVFAAVPILYLAAIVALNEANYAADNAADNTAGVADRAARQGLPSGHGSPMAISLKKEDDEDDEVE